MVPKRHGHTLSWSIQRLTETSSWHKTSQRYNVNGPSSVCTTQNPGTEVLTLENKLGERDWWQEDSIRKPIERAPGIGSRMERSIRCGADMPGCCPQSFCLHYSWAVGISRESMTTEWGFLKVPTSGHGAEELCDPVLLSPSLPIINDMAQTRPEKWSHSVANMADTNL